MEKKKKERIAFIENERKENILKKKKKKDQLIEKMKSIGSKVAEKVPQSTINNPTTN